MKKIICECEFTPEEKSRVEALAGRLGITETTAGILFARGQDTEEKMRKFLRPSRENFLPPDLLGGMTEAVALLRQAKEEEWRVAVFGDYDADGIGACAILFRAFKEFGIEPYLYVPEREEGYGLSLKAADFLFDEFLPDLIVTADCGISNAAEIEYIKEQGAQVIVTDHHELPETLPDCICINPKFSDDYPYDNLCGAGVAFKLACALIGERAYALLDFCALSTVADSVPLLGENRDIVAEGLKLLREKPRAALTALMAKQSEPPTAQTLAFQIAPRVNAAGRMGDAQAALALFTTEREEEIEALSEKLNAYNLERQRLCDELYEEARRKIAAEGAYGTVIMLSGENWNAGLLGIVAARITEEYCRPALLFVGRGDMLRGSARSIEGVNIFEALKACSEYIVEFGGHAQAAGVNLRRENFAPLKEALEAYVSSHYSREDFEPSLTVSGILEGGISLKLARELELLEPCGVGNRKPLFCMTADAMNANYLKPSSPHVLIGGKPELMYFGGAKDLKLLKSPVGKQLVFDCALSKFRGTETAKGYLKAIVYDGSRYESGKIEEFEETVRALGGKNLSAERHSAKELNELIKTLDERCAWGLCAVARERETLKEFPALQKLPHEMYRLSSGSVRNAVLLYPSDGCDLSAYRDIVFLESPALFSFPSGRAKLYENGDVLAGRALKQMDLSRESMVKLFTALRAAEGKRAGESLAETAKNAAFEGFSPEFTVFALAVFEELGLVRFSGGKIGLVRGKKTDLLQSAIYSAALKLTETE